VVRRTAIAPHPERFPIVTPSCRLLVLAAAVPALWLPSPAAAAPDRAPLTDYSGLGIADVEKGCAAAIAESDEIVERILAVPAGQRTFDNTMNPLEELAAVMGQAFGRYAFLGYVSTDAELREAARAQEEAMNKHEVALGFREDLYEAVHAYAATDEAKALTGERARALEFTLRDYRRNGFGLPAETRDEIKGLRERLVELSQEFEKNVAEWEDGIEVPPDRAAGLPESFLERLTRKENGSYWVSTDYPEVFPFMKFADDAELRKAMEERFWNMGYPDNVALLEEAIALRQRIADLLGYPSWAAYRTEIRMAKDPETVHAFLEDLQARLRDKLRADIAAMQTTYAKDDPDGVSYWDWAYYNNLQLRDEYAVDQTEVSKYFPLDRVLDGLFDITQEMFGLRYVEIEAPLAWHPDVQLFEIRDSATDELIAYFYTDLFPRDGKYNHAAAFPLRGGGTRTDGARRIPVSAIVANMTKPTEEQPSLLTHDEVETLFHEFGHILHETLTRTELYRFAGANTEQDFVEAPSQNLEHWVWEPEVLDRFAAHFETGERMPREMLEGMIAAKHLNSGITTLRQVFYATLDMRYHAAGAEKNTTQILEETHPICGFPNHEGTHMQAGFGHLFGYDAAYYGYLWSDVYGDDMFTVFEENGILNPEVGMKYRREIYEKGGSLDGSELVRNFLGREPDNRAFLRDLGLTVN
jgi:thimet oligopeptidase